MMSPVRLIVLSVRPMKYMQSNVMRMLMGMDIPMMKVALKFLRYSSRISTAKRIPCQAELYTSRKVELTRVVSSDMISTVTPVGSDVLISARAA